MNLNCSNQDPCPVILDSKCVIYEGENLLYIGVNTNDNFRFALEQINTTIGNLILSGGITQLIGDITAYGPGTAVATLATVNSNVGQFGSSTAIPKITVNAKGLVTAISTESVLIPSGSLNFIGDVTGSGNTGSNTTLTLATVNSNVYTSNTFLKFTVNAKGLVTAATPVISGDITSALGYIPYNSTNPAQYITGITSSDVTTALGYTPYNATNPANYISGITGSMVTAALGYTPYNSSNPSNFISRLGLSASTPLAYDNTTGNFTIQQANGSQDGFLSSTDWTTFNSKQASGNYITDLNGEATASGPGVASVTLNTTAVTGKVLTGLNIIGGSITSADTMIKAFGKLQNQINGLVGGSIYQGVWNATTNTPTLTSGIGTQGYYYIVNVAGSTNLDGITDWNLGDWAIFDGTAWQQVDNTDAVVSVNGFTGAVSLITDNISEGLTNQYFTTGRARLSLSAGTGISYDNVTGVITNSAPDQTVSLTAGTGISTSGTYPNFTITNSAPDRVVSLTGAGTTSISGTYPNFTITSNDQYVGTVTSVGLTSSANSLTITNSPITSSGNIGLNFAGSTSQYVRGDGSLATFPTVANEAQRLIEEVYNETGATLTKGTVVYINSGHGNLPTITKALATSDATSAQTFGLVQADITNNNNGYVVVIGNLIDIDTQAYLEGTQLYLSSTTAGAYTSTKQYAPAHLVYIGIVVRSHPTQGIIAVKVQNGYEMDELHNVFAQSPNNNAILQYKTSTSLWTSVDGTTTNIAEGTNLYYTDARARGAVSLTTTGSSGASTYNSTTGVLNVPTYTLAGLGGINLTSLSATSPLLYNNTTGVFSIQQASGSQAGYLSSADWTTFNSKQGTITLTTTGTSGAATFSAGTLNIPQYQAALTNPVTGTGTANYLPKFTGTSALGNSLIWDNGTNVGIGNTNTSYTFDVTGTGRFTGLLTASAGIKAQYGRVDGRLFTTSDANYGDMLSTTGSLVMSFDATGQQGYITSRNYATSTDKPLNYNGSKHIFNGGSVGIGTSSPSYTLDVTGTGRFTGALTIGNLDGEVIKLQEATSTGNSYLRFYSSAGSGLGYIGSFNNGGTQYLLVDGSGTDLSLNGNANLLLRTGGTERMRINSSGNIGIGTSSPNVPLAVLGGDSTYPTANGTIVAGSTSSIFHYGGRGTVEASGTSSALFGMTVNANACGYLYHDGTNYNLSNYISGGAMTFGTVSSERMRITSGGQVLIGSTSSLYTNVKLSVKQTAVNIPAEIWSSYSGDEGSAALMLIKYANSSASSQVFQRFVIDNGNTACGQINGNGASQVAFGSWSDKRLKENIEDLPSQLSNILSLRPVEFDYKNGSGHQIGFIAQEMQEVYDDAVAEGDDGFLTITGWSKTEARLVKAIQEQQTQIEELKSLIKK